MMEPNAPEYRELYDDEQPAAEQQPAAPVEPEDKPAADAYPQEEEEAEKPQSVANGDAQDEKEKRLAAARAKAAAAKAGAAQRRASRRSVSSAGSADGSVPRSEARSQETGGHSSARRGSIRSVMQLLDEAERELKAMDAREAETEEQLQFYSDVVALRKELVVVKKDEARARRQQAMGSAMVAESDPALEADLAVVEEAAQRSVLQHVWTSECEQTAAITDDDTSGWARVNTEDMPGRLRASKKRFAAAEEAANGLYAAQEEKINSNTDERDKTKEKLKESVEEEMASLTEARARLKQLDREQRYHIKRGTHVKERQVPQQKRRDLAQSRVHREEQREFADKCALEKELTELEEQVKQSKRILEDNRKNDAAVQKKLEAQLKETEESGRDVHEMREHLEKEAEELRGLKQDLQRVLQYVRTRHEEDY